MVEPAKARPPYRFVELEAWGIGERKEEGFGEVVFCDSIHTELSAGTGQ